MNTDKEYIIQLITRSLSGEASEKESSALQQWINDDENNRQLFEEYKAVWSFVPKNENKLKIDKEKAWQNISSEISNEEEKPSKSFYLRPANWMAAAAAVILLFFAINWFTNEKEYPIIQQTAENNAPLKLQLPDQSNLDLFRASSVSYKENFSDERSIQLNGSGFFDVAHNPEKPFIVDLGKAQVKVLGTQFYISQNQNAIDVYVLEGKVMLYATEADSKNVVLTAGMQGKYDLTSDQLTSQTFASKNFLAWKTAELIFNETPLVQVFKDLEHTYPIRIDNHANIEGLKLTATFKNEKPEDIFKTFGLLYSFEIEQNDSLFIIR
jgi:ferric-dicitrate binding protein FerR (iron transport regulator)